MKKIILLFLMLGFAATGQVTTEPSPAVATGPVTLFFDKDGTPLENYTGTIYAHIGLTVDGTDWQNVIGSWGDNAVQPALTFVSGTTYKLELTPDLYSYFGVDTESTITKICVVLRAAAGAPQSADIFVNVGSFQVNLTAPIQNSTTILASGSNFTVTATNSGGNASYNLKANGVSINTNAATSSYSYTHTGLTANQNYELVVTQGENEITKSFSVIINPGTVMQAMPEGLEDGINYTTGDATKATLVLSAPGKDFIYVAGSFNNWIPGIAHAMKKDAATGKFWLELTGLTANEMYTYQYWVIDQSPNVAGSPAVVKTADPFSTLVLSPFDDPYIPAASYPDLPAYPEGQEREVTVLQTGQVPYDWQVTDFEKPKKEDLVVYEALVRDFDSGRTYQDLIDKIDYFTTLGINALELMPVMEYEGNESWGYNTVFHMANDKFYGPADKLKELVDLCHQNGIAVILDIALNHAFGRNPMVRMWMDDPDGDGWGGPTAENPYFNTTAKHAYSVGNDFNHQQPLTKAYVKRVAKHWIEEYNIDGFRWDLTKGFTQNCTASDEGCTNSYQQDRVDILKEYADYCWNLDPTHYTIFEHLGQDNEEKEWANYKYDEGKGVMLWGKMTDPYNQLTMGYPDNSSIARVGHAAHAGFTGKRVMGYAESHDEERIMYKNLTYGNSTNAAHDVKSLNVALSRMSAMGAVFFTVPGPKMIWHFGELGWDESIYTCNNGEVNIPGGSDGDCKLDTKPQPQWSENWLDTAQRAQVYYDWKRMIQLKKDEAVFEGTYSIVPASGTSLTPKIYVSDASLPDTSLNSVVVLSNFNVTAQNITPNFPSAGTWYNLMDNSPFEVTDVAAVINLQPGEFRIYGNQTVFLGNEEFTTEAIALYPNPASDRFTLNIGTAKVEIYSVTGQLVKTFKGEAPYRLYDVADMAKGMYLVKITDTENRNATRKLIKE
jgi:1,4-alpha-glucan branching enzyme